MKKRLGLVLFAVFVLSCHSAFAMSGHDLIDGMNAYLKEEKDYTKADYFLAGSYLGYVQGAAEATVSDYPVPSGVTPDRLCQIVADYLKNNPKKLDEPAAHLVRKALQGAYPKYLIRNK